MGKKDKKILKNSGAEYLVFIASIGGDDESLEMRYEDENIWLTQKLMSELYGVTVPAINQHLKRLIADTELEENSAIKKYLITASDGKSYQTKHYNLQAMRKIPMTMADWETRLSGFLTLFDRKVLKDAGRVSTELAKTHAETEFEKFRLSQGRLYTSDFDRFLESLETGIEDRGKEGE